MVEADEAEGRFRQVEPLACEGARETKNQFIILRMFKFIK